MGETISYSGGDIPYVDKVAKITPDTPKPDSEAIKEIKFLRAALEETARENEDLRRDLIDVERQLTDALRRGETAEANVVEVEREVERLREVLRGCETYFAKGVEFDPGSVADQEMLRLVRQGLAARERE